MLAHVAHGLQGALRAAGGGVARGGRVTPRRFAAEGLLQSPQRPAHAAAQPERRAAHRAAAAPPRARSGGDAVLSRGWKGGCRASRAGGASVHRRAAEVAGRAASAAGDPAEANRQRPGAFPQRSVVDLPAAQGRSVFGSRFAVAADCLENGRQILALHEAHHELRREKIRFDLRLVGQERARAAVAIDRFEPPLSLVHLEIAADLREVEVLREDLLHLEREIHRLLEDENARLARLRDDPGLITALQQPARRHLRHRFVKVVVIGQHLPHHRRFGLDEHAAVRPDDPIRQPVEIDENLALHDSRAFFRSECHG